MGNQIQGSNGASIQRIQAFNTDNQPTTKNVGSDKNAVLENAPSHLGESTDSRVSLGSFMNEMAEINNRLDSLLSDKVVPNGTGTEGGISTRQERGSTIGGDSLGNDIDQLIHELEGSKSEPSKAETKSRGFFQKAWDNFKSFVADVKQGWAEFKANVKEKLPSFSFKGIVKETVDQVETHQKQNGEVNQAKVRERKQPVFETKNDTLELIMRGKPIPKTTKFDQITFESFKENVQGLMKDINSQYVQASKTDRSLTKEQFFDAAATSIIQKSVAKAHAEFNDEQLGQFAGKLSEKSSEGKFARILHEKMVHSRTGDGAKDLFESKAIEGVSDPNTDSGTFIRQTSQEPVAAIKKLMAGFGGAKFQEDVQKVFVNFSKNPELGNIYNELYQLGVEDQLKKNSDKPPTITLSSPFITPEIAKRIADLTVDLAKEIAKVKIPDEMKEKLGELATKINERTDPNVTGEKPQFVHKLYSDQIVLKFAGDGYTQSGAGDNKVMAMIYQSFNKVANQIDKVSANNQVVNSAFAEQMPVIHKQIEDILVSAGMPEGSRAQWGG